MSATTVPISPTIDPDTLPAMLTLKQAASICGCSEHHLFNLVKRGEIRGVRLGRAWRIPTRDFLTLCGLA